MNHIVLVTNETYLGTKRPVFINLVSESFRLEQHRHEFIEICYVSEGKGFHYIEDETIPVSKGDLFYLPAGVSHVFRPSNPSDGRLIVYNCLISESLAERISHSFENASALQQLLLHPFPDQAWLYAHDREGIFEPIFHNMFGEFQRQRDHYLSLIHSDIMRLLIHMERLIKLSSHSSETNDTEKRSVDDQIHLIAEKLRTPNDAHAPGCLTEQAAAVGLSERHFRRRFKACTGMTYIEYVRRYRIERSCELLRTTTDKISSIAQQVGYEDLAFFNRIFKKLTGTTPHVYRKTHIPVSHYDSETLKM
ncbi:helix-turn-helix transcriptional regulator [Paenibacillus sp. strain BS8-2]